MTSLRDRNPTGQETTTKAEVPTNRDEVRLARTTARRLQARALASYLVHEAAVMTLQLRYPRSLVSILKHDSAARYVAPRAPPLLPLRLHMQGFQSQGRFLPMTTQKC